MGVGPVTHSLVETYDRPQAAAHCTATAQAAAEQPFHIDRQVLLQASVYSIDARLELLWSNLEQMGEKQNRIVNKLSK